MFTVPKRVRTKPVSAAAVRAHAAKAEEYAVAAASELEASRCIAATSLAIHAGINAADAVCGARLGQRSTGENHERPGNVRELDRRKRDAGRVVHVVEGQQLGERPDTVW